MFPSPTKSDAEVVGLTMLHEIREAVAMPIVAIGGINEGNIKEVLKAGVESVAVIDAVLNTEDVRLYTRKLAEIAVGRGDN